MLFGSLQMTPESPELAIGARTSLFGASRSCHPAAMKFLSDEWFTKVEELRGAAGDLEVPESLSSVLININVDREGSDAIAVHLKDGNFERGHNDAADVTLGVNETLARKIFLENDQAAGMQAFMAGEIKIEGDMTKLMALQTATPSDKQKALLKQIIEVTD